MPKGPDDRSLSKGSPNYAPALTLVENRTADEAISDMDSNAAKFAQPEAYELDWSILMARAQDGDAKAYHRLLESITPYLRSLATRRHRDRRDAEDAVQDVLLTIHAIRHTYDPTRPFGPWLVTIANRRIVDRLRRLARTRSREAVLTQEHETFPAPQTNLYTSELDRRSIHAAVKRLPLRQRTAISLLKLQEMSLKEAAVASGMSIDSLKVSVHRGLKSLRKILMKQDDKQ